MMGELPAQRPRDITVLDMEASIEHLTRGTVRNVDALLVVAEPYYRSLETTGRMVPLARDLGLQHVYVVANKIRSPRDEEAIREYCERRGFEIIAAVPFDESVTEADRQGQALIDSAPASPAIVAIRGLAERLVEQLGIAAPSGSR